MPKAYNFSFTTGSLYLTESIDILALYPSLLDWTKVKEKCISSNVIQAKTQSSLRKVGLEVISRAKSLSNEEIEYFQDASLQEQKYLLWIAICRKYVFIREFAKDVLREKYISLKILLVLEDFDTFFNGKCDWHPELEDLAQSTKTKIREVIFRMMREIGLLDSNNMIVRALLHQDFQTVIQSKEDLLCFPIFDADIISVNP